MIHELDEEATKDIFNEALEIVNEMFPFPDGRIRVLEIFETNNRQNRQYINYGEGGATLTHYGRFGIFLFKINM